MARNARSQQLASQRSRYAGFRGFSDRRRIINPYGTLSGAVSSIAKQAVQTQLQSKVKQYNDGLIGNEDMLSFLQSINGSASLTAAEKADVSSQIAEFGDKIRGDKLLANYSNTDKGTTDRAAAAQALSDFYAQKAAKAAPDSPAASTALQQAGTWKATAASEADAVNKSARSLNRAKLMYQVSQQQPGSEDEARLKAQAFQELASQARADGNETEAVQMETNAQNALNEIPAIQEKATKAATTAERTDIINNINELANQYHDGKLSPQEFAQAIDLLDQRAVAIGDTSIQLSLNKWSDTLAKDIQKGVKRGSIDGGNGVSLPVVLGKGGAGGGTQTDWDQEDGNYSKAMNIMQKWVTTGKDDTGHPYTFQNYVNDMAVQLQNREQTLSSRMDVLDAENPNARIYVNGKKVRVADVINDINTEMDTSSGAPTGDKTEDGGIQEKLNSLVNGNVAMVMETPNQVSSGGNISKSGRGVAKVRLVDVNSLDTSKYVPDEKGIYHELQKEYRPLTDAEKKQIVGGYIYDKQGNAFKVNGNKVETGKNYVDVYDPNTSFSKRRFVGQGAQSVQGITDTERAAYQAQTDLKLRQATGAAELNPEQNPLASDTAKLIQKNQSQDALQKPSAKGNGVFDAAKTLIQPTGVNAFDAIKSVAPAVKSAAGAVGSAISKVVAPQSPYKTPEQLHLPPNQPLNTPGSSGSAPAVPTIIQPPKVNPGLASAPLTVVGNQKPNALQQMAKQTGQQIKIQGPTIPPKPTGPNLGDILKGIGGLASKLFK
jgi:hypothetical protein